MISCFQTVKSLKSAVAFSMLLQDAMALVEGWAFVEHFNKPATISRHGKRLHYVTCDPKYYDLQAYPVVATTENITDPDLLARINENYPLLINYCQGCQGKGEIQTGCCCWSSKPCPNNCGTGQFMDVVYASADSDDYRMFDLSPSKKWTFYSTTERNSDGSTNAEICVTSGDEGLRIAFLNPQKAIEKQLYDNGLLRLNSKQPRGMLKKEDLSGALKQINTIREKHIQQVNDRLLRKQKEQQRQEEAQRRKEKEQQRRKAMLIENIKHQYGIRNGWRSKVARRSAKRSAKFFKHVHNPSNTLEELSETETSMIKDAGSNHAAVTNDDVELNCEVVSLRDEFCIDP